MKQAALQTWYLYTGASAYLSGSQSDEVGHLSLFSDKHLPQISTAARAMKYVALLSGGKDSCYNLLHCHKNGHELVAAASLGPQPGTGAVIYLLKC